MDIKGAVKTKKGFELRRIPVLVSRGVMDKALVWVFPWEVRILTEIHGESAEEKTIDELCSMKGAISVRKMKIVRKLPGGKSASQIDDALDLRGQYEAMARSFESNPLLEPDMEYQRLIEFYGMHNEVNLPNVEKVYGGVVQFRQMLRAFVEQGGRLPEQDDGSGSVIDGEGDGEETPIAEMTVAELKQAILAKGLALPKKSTRAALEEVLLDAQEV